MKVIHELLLSSKSKCDICSRTISEKNANALPLFERGFGIRKSKENCLIVCNEAADSLRDFRPRDRFLLINGLFGAFVCPGNVTKAKATDKVDEKIHATKAQLRNNTRTSTNNIQTIKKVESDFSEDNNDELFNYGKVYAALKSKTLNVIQIKYILSRSAELNLTSNFKELLYSEYIRLNSIFNDTHHNSQ